MSQVCISTCIITTRFLPHHITGTCGCRLQIPVGANGSTSDCAVFNASPLRLELESGNIGFQNPEPLSEDPLRAWMMKPFSNRNMSNAERIFNYRLSWVHRIVESAFGIFAKRFRCLLTTMMQEPESVKTIVLAALCLHNMMWLCYPGLQNLDLDNEGNEHEVIPGAWRNMAVLEEVQNIHGGNIDTRQAKKQRTRGE
jgi:hypothetical protein